MPLLRRPVASSRRLTLLLAIVLVPPALTLVWLGMTLLDQDRAMLAERTRERQQAAAESVTRALIQSMSEAERWLVDDDLPEGAVRLRRSAGGYEAYPAGRILWYPEPPNLPEAATEPFAEAERLEFTNALDRGLAVYRELSASPDRAVRAGALLRLARVQRRLGRTSQALDSYRQLAEVSTVALNRTPVDLIARRMIGELLREEGRNEELTREATMLRHDLLEGKWRLDWPAWQLAVADIEAWTGPLDGIAQHRLASQAAEWIAAASAELSSSGRRVIDLGGEQPLTMTWQVADGELRAVMLMPRLVDAWVQAALARSPTDVEAALTTAAGEAVAGKAASAGDTITVRPAESGLPWALVVAPASGASADTALSRRRLLLIAGLLALGLLFSGGGYLLWRVVRQESDFARLQTEFVSVVSHEFRTPLTSLRHITELLQESDDLPPGRRQALYDVLGQSTGRLHRLVESLLDFARMEEGRRPFHLQRLDATAVADDVVRAFRAEHPGAAIEVDIAARGSATVEADADALAHALWNLLDNAVKYSPGAGAIQVSVQTDGSEVAIAVRDQGLGIPGDEQREIFGRFVRGRAAATEHIGGTGLGLAMVSHIVAAHGGRIDLESRVGRGSTFTIRLAIKEAVADEAHGDVAAARAEVPPAS